MKRSIKKELNVRDWWIYGSQPDLDYYPEPDCKFSDHRFLSNLLQLTKVKRAEKSLPKGTVVPITLYSDDSRNKITAIAIRKNKITTLSSTQGRKERYYFGNKTYLLLNTALAGTICAKYYNPEGNEIANTVRPLIDRPKLIQKKIREDVSGYRAINLGIHQEELLTETSELISQKSFIQAVIYLLSELNLADYHETIIKNGTMIFPTRNS